MIKSVVLFFYVSFLISCCSSSSSSSSFVTAVTVSGVPCRKGETCQTQGYDYFWCYVDEKRWEKCCNPAAGCIFYSATNETWCNSAVTPKSEATVRCRSKPLAFTVTGRACALGEFCGLYGYDYEWCYTSEDRGSWDYCCFAGSNCELRRTGTRFANACRYCVLQKRGRSGTKCVEKWRPCEATPKTRSVNNYDCLSECGQGGKSKSRPWGTRNSYAWCWVTKTHWDFCCAIGEKCGGGGGGGGGGVCFVAINEAWPMKCITTTRPVSLPANFRSPSTPIDLITGEIIAIVIGSLMAFALLVIMVARLMGGRSD